MPLKVIPIKASQLDHDNWKWAAEQEGMSFSAWARRGLIDSFQQAKAELAEREQLSVIPSPPVLPIATTHRCPPKGVYCKGCGK